MRSWGEIIEMSDDSGVSRAALPGLPADGATAEVALQARLRMAVRVGTTELPLSRIMALAPGEVVALDAQVGGPVEILVADKPVAIGELVSLDGRLGVRILEVLPSEAD
jgi:flagellar motor switch protein FliN/FliY